MKHTIILLILITVMSGCAHIQPLPPTPFSPGAAYSNLPLGLTDYEGPHPAFLEREGGYTYEELASLQSRSYRRHRYVDEQKGVDIWKPSLIGDCDDYAMFIHFELAKRGIDSRLVISYIKSEGFHHLSTEVDGWVFDNRFRRLKRRDDLADYEWIAIGKTTGPWHTLD